MALVAHPNLAVQVSSRRPRPHRDWRMNILVTGNAGYIGPVVTRVLREAGHTVIGYDLGLFGNDPLQTTLVGDIRESCAIDPFWPDVVVHLAGISNDPMGDIEPSLTRDINVDGTRNMMLRYPEARHVVISSCAVYGQADELCDETSTLRPQTQYARCKADIDLALEFDAYRASFDWVSLRLGT